MHAEARARSYHRWQLGLAVGGLLLAAAYLVTLLATGAAVALRDRLSALTTRWWVQLLLALVILGAGDRKSVV